MDLELEGRVAVVTGASKGIGLAVARTLAAEGALVVAGARTVQTLADLEGVTGVASTSSRPAGRDEPIPVELDLDERHSLDLTDEGLHHRLPGALQRHHTESVESEMLPLEHYRDASLYRPVRLLQNHSV